MRLEDNNMKRAIAGVLLLVGLSVAPALAWEGDHALRRDIRHDQAQIAHDRRELRRDLNHGDYAAARHAFIFAALNGKADFHSVLCGTSSRRLRSKAIDGGANPALTDCASQKNAIRHLPDGAITQVRSSIPPRPP